MVVNVHLNGLDNRYLLEDVDVVESILIKVPTSSGGKFSLSSSRSEGTGVEGPLIIDGVAKLGMLESSSSSTSSSVGFLSTGICRIKFSPESSLSSTEGLANGFFFLLRLSLRLKNERNKTKFSSIWPFLTCWPSDGSFRR